jgi:transcriptional regulator with XRE-family HTH domain
LIYATLLDTFVLIKSTKGYLMELGKRIQELRKKAGLSQTDLAQKINISYTQMSRYEVKNVQPPADVLKKIADVFGVSVDYLISGDSEEKAKATLKDTKLLQLFKAVEGMNEKDKNIITELISTFVFQRDTQKRLGQ